MKTTSSPRSRRGGVVLSIALAFGIGLLALTAGTSASASTNGINRLVNGICYRYCGRPCRHACHNWHDHCGRVWHCRGGY